MLTSLTQKLCPLLTLSALYLGAGCGKQIAEKQESLLENNTEQQLPNSVVTINLKDSSYNYLIEDHGDFLLPYELRVNRSSANTAGKSVNVYYNISTQGDYELKCVYNGNPSGDRMFMSACYNAAGGKMGTTEQLLNTRFFVDKHRFIRLQTASSGLDVTAIYQMRWAPASTR